MSHIEQFQFISIFKEIEHSTMHYTIEKKKITCRYKNILLCNENINNAIKIYRGSSVKKCRNFSIAAIEQNCFSTFIKNKIKKGALHYKISIIYIYIYLCVHIQKTKNPSQNECKISRTLGD